MQIFDSQTVKTKIHGHFHVHTRLNLIGLVDQQQPKIIEEHKTNSTPRPRPFIVGQNAEARRGFLDNLVHCQTCGKAYQWDRNSQAYYAEHAEGCKVREWIAGFQLESMVACELKKWVTPKNVAETLRYQDHFRANRQEEQQRLTSELELLQQQTERHYQYRSNPHLISSHQLQLHTALEKANQRRMAYLEATLSQWENDQDLLNDDDALALCMLARDFADVWSSGSRAVRRKILHELISEIRLSQDNNQLGMETQWRILGFGQMEQND